MGAHEVRIELLRRGESYKDLAARIPYTKATIGQVCSGRAKSWPKFRAAVAADLGRPEHELFPEVKRTPDASR